MTTLLHCADLHLEACFAAEGLPPAVGDQRRASLRQTFAHILALATERGVDAVTIAGDLYEQDYASPEVASFLAQQFAAAAPIPFYIVPGEHDPWTEDSLYAFARWPDNVHLYPPGALSRLDVAPTVRLWGAAHPLAPHFALCPDSMPEGPGMDILLLHAAQPPGEEALRAAGFDLALLGGVQHARLTPPVIYPGSAEPLSWAEAAGEHVAALITLGEGAPRIEAIPVSQTRYLDLTVDLSGCGSLDDAAALIGSMLRSHGGVAGVDECSLARVTLIGARRFDLDLAALRAQVATPAWVEYDVQLAPAYNPEDFVGEPTPRGLLVQRLQERLAAAAESEGMTVRQALNLALRALDGRRVRPE